MLVWFMSQMSYQMLVWFMYLMRHAYCLLCAHCTCPWSIVRWILWWLCSVFILTNGVYIRPIVHIASFQFSSLRKILMLIQGLRINSYENIAYFRAILSLSGVVLTWSQYKISHTMSGEHKAPDGRKVECM